MVANFHLIQNIKFIINYFPSFGSTKQVVLIFSLFFKKKNFLEQVVVIFYESQDSDSVGPFSNLQFNGGGCLIKINSVASNYIIN